MSKLLLLLIPFLVITIDITQADDELLKGCRNPAITAEALSNVANLDWNKIRITDLRNIWPDVLLTDVDCEYLGKDKQEKKCMSLHNLGRFIDQRCECCETFVLDSVHPGKEEVVLDAVIVYFSSGKFIDTVRAAQKFLLTLKPADASSFLDDNAWKMENNAIRKSYGWEDPQKNLRVTLDADIYHVEDLWILYLYFGKGKMD